MKIVIAVGLPGSGKSTYFAQLGVNAISSDAIRLQLADDETDQTIHARVFATVRYLLRQRLQLGRPVTYIDATNLTPKERKPYVKIAREYGCEIEALYFDVPLSNLQGAQRKTWPRSSRFRDGRHGPRNLKRPTTAQKVFSSE